MPDLTSKEIAEVLVAIRIKLLRIVILIFVVWAIFYAFISDLLIEKIRADLLPKGANLIYRAPLEGLILKLKISLIFGILFALPYIVKLVYTTLKERTEILSGFEVSKSRAVVYAFVAFLLFIAGLSYGYMIMLPLFLQFLYESARSQGVLAFYSLSDFINFIVLMLVVFGVIFQMPLFMYILVKNGVADIRTFKYYRRHFYIAFLTIAAIVTPPDIFTQLMVGVPLILFFEISIVIVGILTRFSRS